MTLTLIEDGLSEEEQLAQIANPTVKCSWCGEIIRLEGEALALAMCPACYASMLAEYEQSLKTHHAASASYTSDRYDRAQTFNADFASRSLRRNSPSSQSRWKSPIVRQTSF